MNNPSVASTSQKSVNQTQNQQTEARKTLGGATVQASESFQRTQPDAALPSVHKAVSELSQQKLELYRFAYDVSEGEEDAPEQVATQSGFNAAEESSENSSLQSSRLVKSRNYKNPYYAIIPDEFHKEVDGILSDPKYLSPVRSTAKQPSVSSVSIEEDNVRPSDFPKELRLMSTKNAAVKTPRSLMSDVQTKRSFLQRLGDLLGITKDSSKRPFLQRLRDFLGITQKPSSLHLQPSGLKEGLEPMRSVNAAVKTPRIQM